MSADFTLTSRVDESRAKHVASGELPPDAETIVHDLLDSDGNLIAVGMLDADARIALAARAHPDTAVIVKKGALGKTSDHTTTVGDLQP